MSWTAVMPLKQGRACKSRLSRLLDDKDRSQLSDAMATHVLTCLQASSSVDRIILLSPHPAFDVEWWPDGGKGLNAELDTLRSSLGMMPILILHADLPLLTVADIDALAARATYGVAIAPDRHGTGTNALALGTPTLFAFGFGPASFATHMSRAARPAEIVRRRGLSNDIDTPEDFALAVAAGFLPPPLAYLECDRSGDTPNA